jgi:hypothetical protein
MDDPLGVHVNAGGEGEPPEPLPPCPGARIGARHPHHPSSLHEKVHRVFVGGQFSWAKRILLSSPFRFHPCHRLPVRICTSRELLQSDVIAVPVPGEMRSRRVGAKALISSLDEIPAGAPACTHSFMHQHPHGNPWRLTHPRPRTADPELAAIRAKRMAQLQGQAGMGGGGGMMPEGMNFPGMQGGMPQSAAEQQQQQEKQKAADEQRMQILKALLTPGARERRMCPSHRSLPLSSSLPPFLCRPPTFVA